MEDSLGGYPHIFTPQARLINTNDGVLMSHFDTSNVSLGATVFDNSW
jgi:hypothetical protein